MRAGVFINRIDASAIVWRKLYHCLFYWTGENYSHSTQFHIDSFVQFKTLYIYQLDADFYLIDTDRQECCLTLVIKLKIRAPILVCL